MKNIYFKDARNGWQASTTVELPNNRQLELYTRKDINGNLTTRAIVCWLLEGGAKRHAISYGAAGGDFSQQIKSTKPARITQNVIEAQHETGLMLISQITAAAIAYYEKPDAPNADLFEGTVLQEKAVV